MKKKAWKSLSLVAFLTTIMCVFGFTLMHEVKAEPTEQWVEPGAGTLKEAVEKAPKGAILKLRAGSYTGKTDTYGKEIEEEKIVHVKHSITIDGAGMFDNGGARNSMYTTVSVPFVIEADTEDGEMPTVTFKNFSSSNQSVPHDFVLVKVEKPTNLNMQNVENWGIARDLHVKGAGSLLLDTEADGSVVNLNRTLLDRFGTSFGIDVKSSNTTIKVENNSAVYGRTAINFDGGSGNNVSISDSRIEGRDIYNTDANVIEFNNQSNTNLNISNCIIEGNNPTGDSTSNVVYFKGSNSEVKVNLKDVKITEQNDADKSTIFNFGESTHSNNNVITMNNSSSITFKEGGLSLDNKYNKSDKYAVVGIYDRDGNSEIKVYDNDTAIEELESKSSLEGYKFKGWFKQYDGAVYSEEYEKGPDGAYPKAASNTNMDLYPKFVKEVKVTIGKEGKPHTIEEGQTLEDILNVDTELDALKKEWQNLKGYIMHGVTGSSLSVTAKTVEELKKIKITEDVTVEAVHTVTLTVNDKEFELDSGDTVEKIGTHDGYTGTKAEYDSAKLNNKDDLHFSRLVYDGTKDTFDENTPITSNTKVVTKHYAVVTLGSDSETKYRVEEGEKISTGTKYLADNTKLVDALKAIKEAPVEDKSFSRFVDSDNTTINLEGEEESKISKDTNIKAIYSIKVQIGENKPFTIDEGGSLKDLDDDDNIKGQLKALVDAVKDKTFTGFWVSVTGKEDKELVKSTAASPDDAIAKIIDKKLSENTTIYADFKAKVTICPDKNCESDKKEFTIDSGKTLNDVEKENASEFEKAKYQKYSGQDGKEDRFSRFVDIDGTTFEETAEIEKDITLIPKYYAYVTIDDERENVKGQYKVEEGKSISDIETDEGKLALATLRSNIETLDDTGEELHFEKLVDSDGRDVDTTVTGDITIKGLYHYDVDIIEDYDDPHNTSGVDGHEGFAGFIVYRNENLKTSKESDGQLEKVNASLDKLVASANKKDGTRKFKAYKETNTNQVYDSRDALLDKVFNYHININALVAYKVKVGENVEDFVVEGDTISNSESNLLVDAINKLKNVSDKVFDKYVINEEEKDEIPADTVINEYTEISAKYNVRIKIGEDDDTGYLIPEGKTLSSLPEETQKEVKAKLEALQKKEGFNFDGYSVDEKTVDDVMKKEFNQNTTIVPKFNIIVTINCPNSVCSENGHKTFQLATGDTIKTIGDEELNKIKNAEKESSKVFNRFVGEDGNTFSEDTKFERNTTLTAKYAYEVTIDDDDTKYKVEEGTAINDDINAELKEKLDELENVEGKTFDRFIDADTSDSIDRVAGQITKPTKIKPIYSVTVTINGSEFKVDEGGSLKDKGDVKNALDALKDASGKEFDKYVVDGKEKLTREELLEKKFNSNASVTAKYNVRIKTNEDDEGFLIPEGSKFSDITGDKLESVTKNLPDGKSSFAYFVDENGSKIDNNYTFNKSMTITPKYNVKINIEGVGDVEVLEGSKVSSATELIKQLNSNSDKRFNSFEDGTTLESTVDKSIDLVPIYEIDITIRTGNEEKKYTFVLKDANKDGVPVSSLTTCGDKHLRFEENDKKVEESTKFNKHTNLVEIYKVEVTVDRETFTFESGNTLSSNILSTEQMGILNGKLSALKDSPDGIRGFSRFVNKQTGETIDEKDFEFIQDTEIIPKYNVILTVVRKDDNGNEIDVVEIQLGEGLTISELKEEEYKKLQEKLDEVVKELEKEGKVNWAFSKFLDEEGNEVDLKNTKIDKDSKLIAVFEEKKPDTPDLGEITGNNSNNDKQPSKVAVPDTAGGENNIVTTIIDVILFMLSILLISGPVVMYKTIKVKNK